MNDVIKKPRERDARGKFKDYILPVNQIVNMYISGQSEKQIAKIFNVGRGVIRHRLLQNNISIRNQSERIKIVWEKMSGSQRKSQTDAAHISAKGRIVSWETKCKHAKTVEKNPSNFSHHEIELQKMLSKRGIKTTHQKAIGAYNCDLAAHPVAVEIHGGGWHSIGRHAIRFKERTRYLLKSGWFVYIIPVSESFPLTDTVADYLASYIKRIRRTKSNICEYRMVWGAGEFTTTGSLKDNNFSLKPPFTNARDITTGQYKRIPK